jgi:hypothetical protein
LANWDDYWQDMRSKQLPGVEQKKQEQRKQEREQQEIERRRQERQAAFPKGIADVARWAQSRYESAMVSPLPIYAAWWTKKGLFGQQPTKQRRQITFGYPLYQMAVHSSSSGDYPKDPSHYLLLVTQNKKIVGKHLGDSFYPPEVIEVELFARDLDRPKDMDALLSEHAPTVYPWLSDSRLAEDDFGIGDLCKSVVNYVGNRFDPII